MLNGEFDLHTHTEALDAACKVHVLALLARLASFRKAVGTWLARTRGARSARGAAEWALKARSTCRDMLEQTQPLEGRRTCCQFEPSMYKRRSW